MKFNIKNHNDTAIISVEHAPPLLSGGTDSLVLITSDRVGLSFVHLMTIEQAIFMAEVLKMAAHTAGEKTKTNTLEAQP